MRPGRDCLRYDLNPLNFLPLTSGSAGANRGSSIASEAGSKSSIWVAQNVECKLRNFLRHKFWARGYFVSTVGRDEETIRAYIRNQEMADKQLDQMQLKLASMKSRLSYQIPKSFITPWPMTRRITLTML